MDLAGTLRAWWSNLRTRADYATLSTRDRDRLARDLRLPSATLDQLVAKGDDGRPLQLPEAMGVFGLDAAAVARRDPSLMRDLEATCALCGEEARCRSDGASVETAGRLRTYCPNAASLQGLAGRTTAHWG